MFHKPHLEAQQKNTKIRNITKNPLQKLQKIQKFKKAQKLQTFQKSQKSQKLQKLQKTHFKNNKKFQKFQKMSNGFFPCFEVFFYFFCDFLLFFIFVMNKKIFYELSTEEMVVLDFLNHFKSKYPRNPSPSRVNTTVLTLIKHDTVVQ